MVVAGCWQARRSRTSAKRSREETESRMSEVKRHRNTPLWREIDSLRMQANPEDARKPRPTLAGGELPLEFAPTRS